MSSELPAGDRPAPLPPRAIGALRRSGRRAASGGVVVWAARRPEVGGPRLAVAASKTFGGAVVRNRMRRRAQEACWGLQWPAGWDVLVVVGEEEGVAQLQRDISQIMEDLQVRIGGRQQGAGRPR